MNFEKEFRYAQAVIPNPQVALYNTRKNMKIIENYIEKLKKDFNVNEEDIESVINDYLINTLEEYVDLGSTRLLKKQVASFNYLASNPQKLKELYKKAKDKDLSDFDMEKEKYRYYGNQEECINLAIEEAIYTLRQSKEMVPEGLVEIIKKLETEKNPEKQKKYKKMLESNQEMKHSIKYIASFIGDTEEEALIKHVIFRRKEMQERLDFIKKGEIKISGDFLEKFGFLEEYLNQQNEDNKFLGIPEMEYNLNGQNGEIGLVDIFKEDFLNTLTSEQLTILNSFWQNRFTKNMEQILDGLFVYNTLGNWKKIKNGEEIKQPDDDTLLNILYKNKMCKRIYTNLVKKAELENQKKGREVECEFIDLGVVTPNFRKEYHNYFRDRIAEGKNDIIVDLKSQDMLRNQIALIYNQKDDMIDEMLMDIEYSKNITNWGYIPENNNGKNSMINENKFILIGIDYPGFNMPLRLHVNKNQLIKFMKNIKNSTVIPVYNGAEDMIRVDGSNISTKIYMPLTPKTESALIKKCKSTKPDDVRNKFYTHLLTLSNKKIKNKKVLRPEKYIDIVTMQEQNPRDNEER